MSHVARRWLVPILLVLLLAHPVLQPAMGHGGRSDAAHHSDPDNRAAGLLTPEAERLTPEKRYVTQASPATSPTMVVWEEREVGRDWDIMAYNLTTDGPAFPVTIESVDQRNPVVNGPWIAWEEHTSATVDIKVLNLRTGEQIDVPDTGLDDVSPALGDGVIYWKAEQARAGLLRGYDLQERRMLQPAGNAPIQGKPAALGSLIAWGEGKPSAAKIRVMDVATNETWDVPKLYKIHDGVELSKWGVAWIADISSGQDGVYTIVYDWEEEETHALRTGKYPHENLAACETGVVWDQFEQETFRGTVAIWDGYTRKVGDFGYENSDGACNEDDLIYEKEVPAEDEDLGNTTYLYRLDMRSVRAPSQATITIDPGLENGIFSTPTTFSGEIILGDPREELEGLWVRMDGGPLERADGLQVKPGVYRWKYEVNPNEYFNGQHTIMVVAIDALGTQTEMGWRFFVSGTYQASPQMNQDDLDVPREEAKAFPHNIFDHYEDYRPFYNTLGLAIVLVAGLIYAVFRYLGRRPVGTPEYVRPQTETTDGSR